MLIPPQFQLTSKIVQLLQEIEGCKEVINSVAIPPELENNIRRKSSLKSSLFSARIEGSTLTWDEVQTTSSKDQKKIEVFNILKAINLVNQRPFKDLTLKDITNLHQITMQGLVEKTDLGHLRTNLEAIFNSAGIAVYLPPRPTQINPLLTKLLKYINSNKETFVPIRAILAHYIFEKIHPFLDGNGRVGRLLLLAVLHKGGLGMKGLLSIEEHLDNHRANYYQTLENPERDVTDYLEFMLEALNSTAQLAKQAVLEQKQMEAEDYLLPRRAEILNIIKDHGLVNFETIRRRFLAVNPRTLRYDLLKLQNQGFIKKRGTTKGVYYEVRDESAKAHYEVRGS
ncbi:Fic family protein [Patescibacteria group bacterium]|nr:Fic family protein [Patescibacteria group bacterium]MCL5409539.1 Fic family protein [Patescibacteria group bacterium]